MIEVVDTESNVIIKTPDTILDDGTIVYGNTLDLKTCRIEMQYSSFMNIRETIGGVPKGRYFVDKLIFDIEVEFSNDNTIFNPFTDLQTLYTEFYQNHTIPYIQLTLDFTPDMRSETNYAVYFNDLVDVPNHGNGGRVIDRFKTLRMQFIEIPFTGVF